MKPMTWQSLAGTPLFALNAMTRAKSAFLALALIACLASAGYPQALKTPQNSETPVFRVEVWGRIFTDFDARVSRYFELRSELEKGLPPRRVTKDVAEIRRAVCALAKRLRAARQEAKQGDIFTPTIGAEFRKALLLEMDANTWEAIMDENPGEISVQINGNYPEGKPLSMVPPNVLAALPPLPDDIQYRFLGRHLILYDTRANLIIDRIPYAIQCEERESTRHR
jgi:hypothetical protein